MSASFGSSVGNLAERIDRALRVARILVEQPEVVPAPRVVGIALNCLLKQGLGGIDVRQVEQGDTLIERRDLQAGVESGRFLESLQTFFEQLLVHVGRAEVVQTGGFEGICRVRA